MPVVTGRVHIDAPPARVWAVLSDFGEIARWSPTVGRSRLTTEFGTGVGTRRQLEFIGGRHVDREVEDHILEWDEGQGYLVESLGMRIMKYVRNEWIVADHRDGTSVTLTFDFAARFGPLGALAERLMMRREVGMSVRLILGGLKHHVETGEAVGRSLPDSVVDTVSLT